MSGLQILGQLLIHIHVQIQPALEHLLSLLSHGLVMLSNSVPNFDNLQLELPFCTLDLLLEPHDASLHHLPKRNNQPDQREKLIIMIGATLLTSIG